MTNIQETKNIFQRSQLALKISSIVCGVISLALFLIVLSVLYGLELFANISNLSFEVVVGGSLLLVGFAVNFVVLDYALRARIKEIVAIATSPSDTRELAAQFVSKIRAHGTVLKVFSGLGIAQIVYTLVVVISLPATYGGPSITPGSYEVLLVSGLVPVLVHLKLANILSVQAKALLAQVN
jgi:hypothetical protein